MTTTRTEGLRQSDRVSFRMPLEASWMDSSGIVRRLIAQSWLVSRNGGVLCMDEKFFPGQEISLKRPLEGDGIKSARTRIVAEIDREPDGFFMRSISWKRALTFGTLNSRLPTKRAKRRSRVC